MQSSLRVRSGALEFGVGLGHYGVPCSGVWSPVEVGVQCRDVGLLSPVEVGVQCRAVGRWSAAKFGVRWSLEPGVESSLQCSTGVGRVAAGEKSPVGPETVRATLRSERALKRTSTPKEQGPFAPLKWRRPGPIDQAARLGPGPTKPPLPQLPL